MLCNRDDTRRLAENWHPEPRRIHTFGGKVINLVDIGEDDIDIEDIAHALSNINRFNGHTAKPYTVLSHSLCASVLMPEGKRMEGLLHDAAEAYIGDIITPMKELFPSISEYEDKLLAIILNKYDVNKEANVSVPEGYKKSPVMLQVDRRLGKGEHAVLQPAHKGEEDHTVLTLMQEFWNATPENFIERYIELGGKL